ncbi:MAG: hypothetical protein ACRCXB_22960 [Aeromonadaceae bacterium]
MSKRPLATAITATNKETGEVHHYKSMVEAAKVGGFDYQMVQNCVRGLSGSHAGFTFKPVSPLRSVSVLRPRVQEAAQYLNQGLSHSQTAKVMGLAVGTISVYARQARCLGVLNA